LRDLAADAQYALRARIKEADKDIAQFTSKPFGTADLKEERFAFSAKWKPERLWDLHTPKNTYDLELSLIDAGGKLLDTGFPVRFGFREFWIDGRDFCLNGSRVFLSAVPLDNAQVGAAWASYAGARESLERLQSFGINYYYSATLTLTRWGNLAKMASRRVKEARAWMLNRFVGCAQC